MMGSNCFSSSGDTFLLLCYLLALISLRNSWALGGYLFNYTSSRNEQKATQVRDKTERDIASDNQRETALQDYIDKMSELLLDKDHPLRESAPEDEVRKIARVRTLTVLPRLDKERKRSVLQFLHESGLIDKGMKIIDLDGADLNGANLILADLGGADLNGANLILADLGGADLHRAILDGAKLHKANLNGANLGEAILGEAQLYGADLGRADLHRAILDGADLVLADLSKADLHGAILGEAKLDGADLRGANLNGADLGGADLDKAKLSEAKGTTTEQLDKAKSLTGAIMPDWLKHP